MTDTTGHLDEGTIHAWLDGALSPDESARVEAHANSCTECSALVAEARGLVAASSRILSSLDAVPAGVLPGTDSGTDQLAALRARRQAANRAWWRDRRFVAAASLVLVAGLSSVVWRTSEDETVAASADSAVAVQAPQAAAAPTVVAAPTPTEPAATEARVGNAKVVASQPLRDSAPARVAVRQASDSFADVKLMSASVASGAREASSVTESRQAADSTKALARAEQSAFERKVQQAAQSVPTPPRIIPEQQQAGAAAPPASPSPLVARNRAAVMDAAADALESVPMAGRCYRLGVLTPGGASRIETFPDTIRLLDEPMPGRIDPSWRRATGAPGAELAWRMVDSVTAELRILLASDSSTVRFRVTPGTAPDVSGLSGVRAAMAAPVRCR